jgi:hypothetical protein
MYEAQAGLESSVGGSDERVVQALVVAQGDEIASAHAQPLDDFLAGNDAAAPVDRADAGGEAGAEEAIDITGAALLLPLFYSYTNAVNFLNSLPFNSHSLRDAGMLHKMFLLVVNRSNSPA